MLSSLDITDRRLVDREHRGDPLLRQVSAQSPDDYDLLARQFRLPVPLSAIRGPRRNPVALVLCVGAGVDVRASLAQRRVASVENMLPGWDGAVLEFKGDTVGVAMPTVPPDDAVAI